MTSITHARLRKLLDYDPKTGHLTWRDRNKRVGRGGMTRAGRIAGCINGSGKRCIGISGKIYLASRLAFFWMTSRWPRAQMDHINSNRGDNRWSNLREATSHQNNANRQIRKKKRVPFKGVRWHKINGNYQAQITVKGRYIHLGVFETPEEAHTAYRAAARKHFGRFARFA
jgi:hypothetical protein